LDLGDTGGSSNKDNFLDRRFVQLGILQDLLDGSETLAEEIAVEFLESGTGDGGVEVNSFIEGVDFDGGLSS
jgi:hypothetical protein